MTPVPNKWVLAYWLPMVLPSAAVIAVKEVNNFHFSPLISGVEKKKSSVSLAPLPHLKSLSYITYSVHPVSCETASKTTKKIPKNSKQIFLFKVIAINCNTPVGVIFIKPMYSSWKINNKNSLQFRHYRCLNVAYGCISVLFQFHFQLWKCKIVRRTQIRRVRGMVKSFAWATRCSPCSAVNPCGTNRVYSSHFFKSSDICGERRFLVSHTLHHHPTTSTVVVLQNSCHPSNVISCFYCSGPSTPLCVVFNQLLSGCKQAIQSKYRVTKRFNKHFPFFAAMNPTSQQNFIVKCLKFFPW